MKKSTGLFLCVLVLQYYSATAQSFAINTTGAAANLSAMLDITSTDKGLLIPRLSTAQRNAIALPGKGLLVYDSSLKSFYFHDGLNWQPIVNDSSNLWRKNGNNIYNSNTGNVGIGTTTAQSLLQVKGGAVLFDSTIGGTPLSGAGTRMMWVPDKAAFRAGIVNGTQWDDANIGYNTFAIGTNNIANSPFNVAMGQNNTAGPGKWAFVMGSNSTASGDNSVAMGEFSSSSGSGSTALSGGHASGRYATGLAPGGLSSGYASLSTGFVTTASGDNSLASGYLLRSKSFAGTVIGTLNDTASTVNPTAISSLNRLFQIGNGTQNPVTGVYTYSNAMTVLQNGNVGIGTTTPAFLLTVKNDINLDNGDANAGTTTNALKFGGNGTGEAIGSNRTTAVNQWGLDFYTGATNRMSIALNGNIGIGTTAPSSKLDVNGQITIDQKNFGGYGGLLIKGNTAVSNYPNIGFSTQNTSANDIISAVIGGNITNNTAGTEAIDLGFYTSTTGQAGLTQRMVIKDNGNIGIGETSPAVPLNFASSLGNKISFWGTGATHYGMGIQGFLMQLYTQDINGNIAFGYGSSSAFTETMRIKGNGNVGIGTSAPSAMLSVNGTANNATGSWAVFSDSRIKTITDDFTDGLSVIKKIQPIKYRYNENAPFKINEEQIGIVAQDLEKIAPYMVSQKPYEGFSDLRAVNNQAYVFLLINAVKEQQEQIEQQAKEKKKLQLQMDLLQKENQAQAKRLDGLEKSLNKIQLQLH